MAKVEFVEPSSSTLSHISVLYEQQKDDIDKLQTSVDSLEEMRVTADKQLAKINTKVDYLDNQISDLKLNNIKIYERIKNLERTCNYLTVFVIILILACVALATACMINF